MLARIMVTFFGLVLAGGYVGYETWMRENSIKSEMEQLKTASAPAVRTTDPTSSVMGDEPATVTPASASPGDAPRVRTNTPDALPEAAAPSTAAAPSAPIPGRPPSEPAAAPPPSTLPLPQGPAGTYILCYYQFTPVGGAEGSSTFFISAKTLEDNLAYLQTNGYQVVPLADVKKALHKEGTLPPHSVAITIDGGFKNALTVAAPILAKYNVPWTLFVYTDSIGQGDYLSWEDLGTLHAQGVDLQSHGRSGDASLVERKAQKPTAFADWVKDQIVGSKTALEEKVPGVKVTAFAYPYGQYNQPLEDVLLAAGYEVGFSTMGNPVTARTTGPTVSRYAMKRNADLSANLHQGLLELTNVSKPSGAVFTEPRPILTATLISPDVDPATIEAVVQGGGEVQVVYAKTSKQIKLILAKDLPPGPLEVKIRALGADKQPLGVNWLIYREAAKVGRSR